MPFVAGTWNAIVIAGKLLEAEQYADSLKLLKEVGDFPSLADKSRALVALFSGRARLECDAPCLCSTCVEEVKCRD